MEDANCTRITGSRGIARNILFCELYEILLSLSSLSAVRNARGGGGVRNDEKEKWEVSASPHCVRGYLRKLGDGGIRGGNLN